MRSFLGCCACAASAVALLGCHTLHFEVAPTAYSDIVVDQKSFFLWGLVPTREVDVSQHCPQGVAAVREETTVLDGFCNLVTLGIWTPRTSTYYCTTPAPVEPVDPVEPEMIPEVEEPPDEVTS